MDINGGADMYYYFDSYEEDYWYVEYGMDEDGDSFTYGGPHDEDNLVVTVWSGPSLSEREFTTEYIYIDGTKDPSDTDYFSNYVAFAEY